jgi:hypothetical protein
MFCAPAKKGVLVEKQVVGLVSLRCLYREFLTLVHLLHFIHLFHVITQIPLDDTLVNYLFEVFEVAVLHQGPIGDNLI